MKVWWSWEQPGVSGHVGDKAAKAVGQVDEMGLMLR